MKLFIQFLVPFWRLQIPSTPPVDRRGPAVPAKADQPYPHGKDSWDVLVLQEHLFSSLTSPFPLAMSYYVFRDYSCIASSSFATLSRILCFFQGVVSVPRPSCNSCSGHVAFCFRWHLQTPCSPCCQRHLATPIRSRFGLTCPPGILFSSWGPRCIRFLFILVLFFLIS